MGLELMVARPIIYSKNSQFPKESFFESFANIYFEKVFAYQKKIFIWNTINSILFPFVFGENKKCQLVKKNRFENIEFIKIPNFH